jgi:hypothetical protein
MQEPEEFVLMGAHAPARAGKRLGDYRWLCIAVAAQ